MGLLLEMPIWQNAKAFRAIRDFLKFRPCCVGGNCIGIAPYSLTDKTAQVGLRSEVIQAGHQISVKTRPVLSLSVAKWK